MSSVNPDVEKLGKAGQASSGWLSMDAFQIHVLCRRQRNQQR